MKAFWLFQALLIHEVMCICTYTLHILHHESQQNSEGLKKAFRLLLRFCQEPKFERLRLSRLHWLFFVGLNKCNDIFYSLHMMGFLSVFLTLHKICKSFLCSMDQNLNKMVDILVRCLCKSSRNLIDSLEGTCLRSSIACLE